MYLALLIVLFVAWKVIKQMPSESERRADLVDAGKNR
jgi:hypothetical protein